MKLFLNNYSELDTFVADTIKAMLVHDYVYDPEHRYVVDASPKEVTDISYSRVELTGKSRLVNSSAGTITYSADNPSFGYVDNAPVDGFILYKELSTDLESMMLLYWPIPEEVLDGTIAYEMTFDPAGIMVVSTGA